MTTFARTITGDLAIPRVVVTDAGAVALQTIKDGLALWEGEWFLDTSLGFPWTLLLGQKVVNTTQFVSIMQQFLLSCIGVATAVVSASFSGRNRSFAYSFTATLNTGAIITGGTNTPFQYQPGAR